MPPLVLMCWVLPLALQSLRKVRQLVAMLLPNLLHQRVVCVKNSNLQEEQSLLLKLKLQLPKKVQARLLRRQKGEAKGGVRTKGRQLSLLLPVNLPHPLSRIKEMVLQSLLAKSAGSLCHLVLSLVAPNAITTLKSDAPRADQKLDW